LIAELNPMIRGWALYHPRLAQRDIICSTSA
jgi:hypothetical protein